MPQCQTCLNDKSDREIEPSSRRIEFPKHERHAALLRQDRNISKAVEISFRKQVIALDESDEVRLRRVFCAYRGTDARRSISFQ